MALCGDYQDSDSEHGIWDFWDFKVIKSRYGEHQVATLPPCRTDILLRWCSEPGPIAWP